MRPSGQMEKCMKTMKVSGWSKCGNIEFLGIVLPVVRVVCPVCDGTGTHVNPAIDGHGLSQEDFDQDPDFAESYFGGAYDIRCDHCGGKRVVDEVNEAECKRKLSTWKGLIRYQNGLDLDEQSRREAYYEQRVGA